MAYLRKKINKNGEIYYKIEVKYYDRLTKTTKTKTKKYIPPKNISPNKLIHLVEVQLFIKSFQSFWQSYRQITDNQDKRKWRTNRRIRPSYRHIIDY